MASILAQAARTALAAEAILRPANRSSRPTSILSLEYLLPLGSCVHMTPTYQALHSLPGVTVTVATRGLALGVFRHSPFIHHLIETPDPLTALLPAARNLRAQLRARNLTPDLTLTGVADQRSRVALLAFFATSGRRGGFTVHPELYHHPLTYNRDENLIANNLQLARLAGYTGPTAPPNVFEPRVFFSAADAAAAHALLAPLRQTDGEAARPILAVVTQNSGGQRTGWHTARWVETLRYAHSVLGYRLAFLGTAADALAIDEIRNQLNLQPSSQANLHSGNEPASLSFAGATTIPTLAALLAVCDMALSLDTGTMHMARAAGLPTVILGPSWQRPLEWLPLGKPNVRILRGPDRDDIPENYKLDEITAPDVIAALTDLTASYPATEEARTERLEASLSDVDLLNPSG